VSAFFVLSRRQSLISLEYWSCYVDISLPVCERRTFLRVFSFATAFFDGLYLCFYGTATVTAFSSPLLDFPFFRNVVMKLPSSILDICVPFFGWRGAPYKHASSPCPSWFFFVWSLGACPLPSPSRSLDHYRPSLIRRDRPSAFCFEVSPIF